MSEHSTDIEEEPAEIRAEFGQTLQHAREQAGFSIEYVAGQLNLPEETVIAIENADMAKLPPAAFVRGYIRVYAKVLEFDADQLLQLFDAAVPHEHEAELHRLSSLPHETSSQEPVIRLVTGFIAVMAVLALIYGAYSYYSQKSEDMEQVTETGTGKLQLPPEAPIGIERETRFDNAGLPVTGEDLTISEAQTTDDAVAVETDNETQTREVVVPALARNDRPEPVVQPPAAAEPVTAESTVEPVTGQDVLVLDAGAESWAEIRDATGERKFYGLLSQGRKRTLSGVAPFDIFLGNAPAVRVMLNDVDVDMTNHTRSNNIAHFKVSAEGGRARFH